MATRSELESVLSAPSSEDRVERRLPLRASIERLVPFLGLVALFVIWEVASNVLAIPRYLAPKPSEIFAAIVSERQFLINHGRLTAIEMLAGFAFGSLFSMAFGLLVVYWAPAKRFFLPYMIVIKTMPKVALAP